MDPQGSREPSIFSSVDFQDFKCAQCGKYLSIPPIRIYTNLTGNDKNICGRCQVPEEGHGIRNVSFEALAKYLEFPCSNSEECPEKMPWNEIEKHETECKYRMITCNNCQSAYVIANVMNHFKQNHRPEHIVNQKLTLTEQHVGNKTYLVELQKIICLVHTNITPTMFTMKIESAFLWVPHFFNISFIIENNEIVFKNREIKDGYGWKQHQFDIDKMREIFMLGDTDGFKVELQLCEEGKPEHRPPEIVREREDELIIKERLATALECPTCFEIMTSNIFVCTRGHSICERCRGLMTICPTCRGMPSDTRNFALEEVVKMVADIII